jgi:hypothetical protein
LPTAESAMPLSAGRARRDSRTSQAARTPRVGARAWVGPGQGGSYPFTPTPRAPEAWHVRRVRVPATQPQRTTRGHWGQIATRCVPPCFKIQEEDESRLPSHQPHWGFLFPFAPACAERDEEGGRAAATPRRGGTRASR